MRAIARADALNEMDVVDDDGLKVPFEILFMTHNRRTGEGGELISLKNCIRCGLSHNMKRNGTIGLRQLDSANHIYAVHWWLIFEFNGKKIFW